MIIKTPQGGDDNALNGALASFKSPWTNLIAEDLDASRFADADEGSRVTAYMVYLDDEKPGLVTSDCTRAPPCFPVLPKTSMDLDIVGMYRAGLKLQV